MNRAEALTLLRSRVRANTTRCHTQNLARDLNAKQCLQCGSQATISEKSHRHHTFCDTQCQRKLHAIDSFLALGMKRGIGAVKEEVPAFELNEGSEDKMVEVTDDVLGDILDKAYERRLMTVIELEQLLAMRRVNQQFRRVIDTRTIPTIRFVCGAILIYVSGEFLAQFRGLEILCKMDTRATGKLSVCEYVPVHTVFGFSRLKELTLKSCYVKLHDIAAAAMPHLEILRLSEVTISDEQVGSFVSLHTLDIDDCWTLTSACLRPLKRLRALKLQTLDNFEDLNFCQQLTDLDLGSSVKIQDDGIAQLVNLEKLSLEGEGDDDDTGDNRFITNRCFLNFPRLRSLTLRNNPHIVNLNAVVENEEHRIRLDELETLDISGNDCGFDIAVAGQFKQLTSLDISDHDANGFDMHTVVTLWPKLKQLNMGGWAEHLGAGHVVLPTALETLIVSECEFTPDFWASMKSLKVLHLVNFFQFGDEQLLSLPQLEALQIFNHTAITNAGLSQMTRLRELMLVSTCRTGLTYNAIRNLDLTYFCAIGTRIQTPALEEMQARGVIVLSGESIDFVDPKPPHYYEVER